MAGSERALQPLKLADAALARGDARSADRMLDEGLTALGNSYRRPDMLDDTGMHLTLANVEQDRRRFKLAARLKRRIFVERLELCGAGPDR